MRIIPPVPKIERFYIASGYLDPAYPAQRRGMGLPADEHPGVDYNLRTGGATDLGYPVVAFAPGRVVHAGRHRVWGNVVLLQHDYVAKALRLPGLWSQYGHLHQVCVSVGDWLEAGDCLGSIGAGDPAWPMLPHLHFELRRRPIPADNWYGRDKSAIQQSYYDPSAFLAQHVATPRRIYRERMVLFENGRREISSVIINIDNPELAQVAVRPL